MKKIIFLLSISIASIANAADHLVTSTEEANTLLNKASEGDKIILKDGVYKNAAIKFTNNNIAFVAEHAGKVFFEENSTLNFSGNNITIDGFVWQNGGRGLDTKQVIQFRVKDGSNATHSIVKNCVINDYNNADKTVVNTWVGLYGQYNTVTNCLFKSKDNRGPTLVVWLDNNVTAHHTISYNYFLIRKNGPDADNGLESIRIGDSKTSFTNAHCVVAFNRFEECDGEIEIISNKSCHNTYLHNTFVNSDGGLTLRHGNYALCDGNFFDGGDKRLSYGIRIIGEGHVAINNYFYHLNGAPNQTFRAPLTIVNGLVNTPLNGYFQVKTATVTDNIFVNCATPNIRMGAFSKRDGMTVAPDTVTIKNNLFFDDAGNSGDVYESLTNAQHLFMQDNTILAARIKTNTKGIEQLAYKGAKRNGFGWIKDGKGNTVASVETRAVLSANSNVGADWVEPSIADEVKKSKYSILSPKQVGPIWMR